MTERTMQQERFFDEAKFRRQLRPAWTPVNIGLMILFFVAGAWPLGLFAIFYMVMGEKIGLDLSRIDGRGRSRPASEPAANSAFEAWREQELARLEAERRKLDEARAAFDEHVAELRRARDAREFEDFQAAWAERNGDQPLV